MSRPKPHSPHSGPGRNGFEPRGFSSPRSYAVMSGLVMMLVTGALLLHYDTTMTRQADKAMRNSLRRAALACSLAVDSEVHRSLNDASQQDSEAYRAACARLEEALHAMEGPEKFRFVYTCVLRDGGVRFVLDPTPAGDADGDGVDDKAYLMQPYPEASAELVSSLRDGDVHVMRGPQSDRWGTFLSGYAPIRDESGAVTAAVGVDMDLAFYQETIRGIRLTTLVAGIIAILISVVVGYSLWHHERRLHSAIDMIRRAKDEASDANQAKGRFLATMSHELRTPMNGFLGMADLLLTTPLSAVQRDYVETIQASGDRLLAIFNDILDYSKTEAGALKLEKKPAAIRRIVADVVQLHTAKAGSKGIRLESVVRPEADVILQTDPGRLKQVLANLVGNALEYTEEGSVRITVSHHREPDGPPCIRFAIQDTGIGIPAENRQSLFQPFHQLDSSASRQHGGIGLGLALCDRLSRAMGGGIEFDSEPGKGSSFYFTMPADTAEVESNGRSAPAAEAVGTDSSATPGGQALLICTDRFLRRLLVQLLTKQGWRVEVLDGPDDTRLAGCSFDLVVFDLAQAREPAAAFARRTVGANPAATHAAIDAGLSDNEREQVLASGVHIILPRNPSSTSLAPLSPGRS